MPERMRDMETVFKAAAIGVAATALLAVLSLPSFGGEAPAAQPPPSYEQLVEARGRLLERRDSLINQANGAVDQMNLQIKGIEEEIAKQKSGGGEMKGKTK